MYYIDKTRYHFIEKNEKYFLFDAELISFFEIDKFTYEYGNNLEEIDPSNVSDEKSFNLINELIEWDILQKDKNQFLAKHKNLNPFLHAEAKEAKIFNSLFLVLTRDCNLRCKYCSADYGKFGEENPINLMSFETAKKSVDFFIEHMNERLEQILIVFVGGEPLLNFDVLKKTVEYCETIQNHEINFALNTNGILMTEEMAIWFKEQNIPVRFSIDGLKNIHDANRIYPDGKGSFDDAIKGYNIYKKHNDDLSVQASIPRSKYLVESVLELWKNQSFQVLANYTGKSLFVDTKDFEMDEADKKLYIEQIDVINDIIIDRITKEDKTQWIHITSTLLERLHNRDRSPVGCGVGFSISITPDEEIYLCQGFVGLSEYTIGNLTTGVNLSKLKSFGDTYKSFLNKCSDCMVRNICSVNCIAQYIVDNKITDDTTPSENCNLAKELLKSTILMYNKLKQSNPEFLDKIFNKSEVQLNNRDCEPVESKTLYN